MSHTKFWLLRCLQLHGISWGIGLYGLIVGACTSITILVCALVLSPRQLLGDILHSVVYERFTFIRMSHMFFGVLKVTLTILSILSYVLTLGLATYVAYVVASLVVLPEALWLDSIEIKRNLAFKVRRIRRRIAVTIF